MKEPSHKAQVAKNLYYLESDGTGEQIGMKYGAELRPELEEAVRRSVDALARRFDARLVQRAIHAMGESFRRNFPYLWYEMEAISTGAGIPLMDLQKHIFSAGVDLFKEGENACTDIIFPKSDVGPLLGKTHDATSPGPATAVIRLIRSPSMNTVLCAVRVDGFSVMTGLNDKGLAIGEASIHFSSSNKSGTIRNLLLRPVLHECSNVKEAVDYLATHPPLSAGFHFALVDESGNSAIVERSPIDQNVRWSRGEAIFCTNHAVTPWVRALEKSRGAEGDRNNDARYANLMELTSAESFFFSLDSMKHLLRFHDAVGGICQHGDPEYKGEKREFYPMITQRAFINMAGSRKLLVANGNPCQCDFLEFDLSRDELASNDAH
jgi:predicted choloylglycine hydrolase